MHQQDNLSRTVAAWPRGKVFTFVRWAVSVVCLVLIGQRLYAADWSGLLGLERAFLSVRVFYLIAAAALVVANLGLEALRWQLCLQKIQPWPWLHHLVAVVGGIAMGLPLTHLVGDFAGKLSLVRNKAATAVPMLMAASMAQYLATLLAAVLGCAYILQIDLRFGVYAQFQFWIWTWAGMLAIGYAFLPSIYAFARQLPLPWVAQLPKEVAWPSLSGLFAVSMLRYATILSQYALLYFFYSLDGPVGLFLAGITLALALKTLVPFLSVAGMVGLRELLLLSVLTLFGFEPVPVVALSLTIWLLNVALPGAVGAFLLANNPQKSWWHFSS